MALRLNARWRLPDEPSPWLTGKPIFAESSAYERLLRELRRYVEDEVTGRSFLIAGHRGAGKTTTVLQAVRVLRDELLLRSRNLEDPGISRRRNLQRPLLIKLVGKALLEPLPKSPCDAGAEEGQDTNPPNQPPPTPGDTAANALGHITIALYRALAREVASGYANHVRVGEHDPELSELAAQLALELDSNPDAATLRNFWDRIGRLEDGVLFWKETDPTLSQFKLRNQGMREIVAVTTAAQAFEICLGQVTDQVQRADEGSRDNTQTISGDVKDLVTRLGTLAAGTTAGSVAGVTTESAAAGVGIGLLVFLLAGITMSFSSIRKRKRSSSTTYTFIRDRSIQTLDRDLPHVLDRIRQAGLAPIFVIDELDKLDDPDDVITRLIGRLKHLISDYGFFCFLTDRDYFDRVERRVSDGSYPVEHTYFSDRLLVVNRPGDMRSFLEDIIAREPAETKVSLARRTLAYALMYRSKLNFSQIEREFSKMLDAEGIFVVEEGAVTSRGGIRLAATIQVAIDHVIDTSPMRTRFIAEPAFAHYLLDALYWVPRGWEKDATKPVVISFELMKNYLRGRAQAKALPTDSSSAEPISDGDALAVWQLVLALMRQLAHLGSLQQELAGLPEDHRLQRDEVILAEAGPILRWDSDEAEDDPERTIYRYKFLLDRDANPVQQPATQTTLKPAEAKKVDDAVKKLELLKSVAAESKLSLQQLVDQRIVLPLLTEAALDKAISDGSALSGHGQKSPDSDTVIAQLMDLTEAVEAHERRIIEAVALAVETAARSDSSVTRAVALTRISRYFAPPPAPTGIQAIPGGPIPDLQSLQVRLASGDWEQKIKTAPVDNNLAARRWIAWEKIVASHLAGNSIASPSFEDLVLAAQDAPPANLFRRDLREMDLMSWSKVALSGLGVVFPGTALTIPQAAAWALPAGLRALGFAIADWDPLLPRTAPVDARAAMADILRAPPDGGQGLLYIYPDHEPPVVALVRDARPTLAVAESELQTYLEGLEWLVDLGLIEGMLDEPQQAG